MSLAPYQHWPGKIPHVTFFEDFLSDLNTTAWSGTAASSGTGAVSDSVPDGVLRLSGAATTDDSGYQIQQSSEVIAFQAGFRYHFQARVRLGNTSSTGDTVTQSDFLFGVAVTDTSLIASKPTDGVYFLKDDGAATISCIVRRDSSDVASAAAVATLVEATWYDLAIEVVPSKASGAVATVNFYIDRALVASLSTTTLPYEAEEYHALSVAFFSGDNSGTRWCDIDYIAGDWRRT